MRVLLYDWCESLNYYYKVDIRDTFQELGIAYDVFQFDFDQEEIEELQRFFDSVDASNYDFCFSVNYFPEISSCCNRINLKYVSWGYDCPFNVVDIEKTLGNACNRVFCFDRIQAQQYIDKGFDTVFHLPLGVNAKRYGAMSFTEDIRQQYKADISFVGSLYEGQYSPIAEICDEYSKGYLEGIIEAQRLLYGAYILDDVIDEQLVDDINNHFKELQRDTQFRLSKEQLIHVIDQEISRRERIIMLNLLGRRYDTHLYSLQDYQQLGGVKVHGGVDYLTQMPAVFNSSKINLNITVKGIQSGVPLRAMDIMASGGFLLSNYQPELLEYFGYDEHMVTYESMEDAIAKCDFYLKNEELRRKIAMNARENVLENHSMTDRFRIILDVI